MNRIDATFANLKQEGKKAFVAYICGGDPSMEATVEIAKSLESVGVDILELGVAFSDPMADGTVNQMAAERALKAGATVADLFETIREIRKNSEMPIVLFAYLNPVYAYGFEDFFKDASEAGADGVLLLDLPPEEQDANKEMVSSEGLRLIRLIAPTSPPDRIRSIADRSEGFIYYVSREGVTGVRDDIVEGLEEQVAKIQAAASVPVVVGFGISKPEQASAVAKVAEGVVVGSAIVRQIEELQKTMDDKALAKGVADFVNPLVQAVKSV